MSVTPERSVSISSSSRSSGSVLRLEKIKIPHFNGKIEEYAQFKEDWQDVVEPELEESAQLRQIRLQVPA